MLLAARAFNLILILWLGADGKKDGRCPTPGCASAASNLLNSMDQNVDPCQNFYQYACGKWKRDNPIPDDESTYATYIEMRRRVTSQLRTLLEDDSDLNTTSNSVRYIKLLYRKCMGIDEIERLNSKPIHSFLNKIGGWPVLNDTWSENFVDITTLNILMKLQFGENFLIDGRLEMDWKNVTNNILMIEQQHTVLPRDFYLDMAKYHSKIAAYKTYFAGIVRLIASDMNILIGEDRIDAHWSNLIDFERNLANITVPIQEQEDKELLYNKFTVANFSALMNGVNVEHFFKGVMPAEVFDRLVKQQADRFVFIVPEPAFYNKFNKLLLYTAKETVFNYMIWHLIHKRIHLFGKQFEILQQEFNSVIRGTQAAQSRWKKCVKQIEAVTFASGALYVRNFFSIQDKKEATILVDNFKKSFKNIIQHSEWMDDATKDHAIEKVNFMINNIGYPDFVLNDSSLDNYFANLSYTEQTSFFDLHHEYKHWYSRKQYFDLLKQYDKDEFPANPADVNAYYNPEKNSITFPAAVLQPPFFQHDFPKYITYSMIGGLIGHEITHGFDSEGHQFDKNGLLRNWWSPVSKKNFERRTECIRNQYARYVEPSTMENVNGNLTITENIADNGGIRIALLAYKSYIEYADREEYPLPGLNLTIQQTFFTSFATFWCDNMKKEHMQVFIKTNQHSPHQFRVNGPLSNIPEFAEAFNCEKGSPMNPDEKCSIW